MVEGLYLTNFLGQGNVLIARENALPDNYFTKVFAINIATGQCGIKRFRNGTTMPDHMNLFQGHADRSEYVKLPEAESTMSDSDIPSFIGVDLSGKKIENDTFGDEEFSPAETEFIDAHAQDLSSEALDAEYQVMLGSIVDSINERSAASKDRAELERITDHQEELFGLRVDSRKLGQLAFENNIFSVGYAGEAARVSEVADYLYVVMDGKTPVKLTEVLKAGKYREKFFSTPAELRAEQFGPRNLQSFTAQEMTESFSDLLAMSQELEHPHYTTRIARQKRGDSEVFMVASRLAAYDALTLKDTLFDQDGKDVTVDFAEEISDLATMTQVLSLPTIKGLQVRPARYLLAQSQEAITVEKTGKESDKIKNTTLVGSGYSTTMAPHAGGEHTPGEHTPCSDEPILHYGKQDILPRFLAARVQGNKVESEVYGYTTLVEGAGINELLTAALAADHPDVELSAFNDDVGYGLGMKVNNIIFGRPDGQIPLEMTTEVAGIHSCLTAYQHPSLKLRVAAYQNADDKGGLTRYLISAEPQFEENPRSLRETHNLIFKTQDIARLGQGLQEAGPKYSQAKFIKMPIPQADEFAPQEFMYCIAVPK